MLSVALQSKIKGGDLEGELNILLSNMIKDQKLISGRQVAHMVCRGLRLNEKMSTVYRITDLCNVKWAGDSFEKISLFKSHWDNGVQNLPTLLDELLCEMLVAQMKQSKEFAMDVKDYYRDAANRNYHFPCSGEFPTSCLSADGTQQTIADCNIGWIATTERGKSQRRWERRREQWQFGWKEPSPEE